MKPPYDKTKGVHYRIAALEEALRWAAETACIVGLHDTDCETFLLRLTRLTPDKAIEAAKYADAEQKKDPMPEAWEEEFWEGLEKALDEERKPQT